MRGLLPLQMCAAAALMQTCKSCRCTSCARQSIRWHTQLPHTLASRCHASATALLTAASRATAAASACSRARSPATASLAAADALSRSPRARSSSTSSSRSRCVSACVHQSAKISKSAAVKQMVSTSVPMHEWSVHAQQVNAGSMQVGKLPALVLARHPPGSARRCRLPPPRLLPAPRQRPPPRAAGRVSVLPAAPSACAGWRARRLWRWRTWPLHQAHLQFGPEGGGHTEGM